MTLFTTDCVDFGFDLEPGRPCDVIIIHLSLVHMVKVMALNF